jgi:predicted HTH transcriptional regulator
MGSADTSLWSYELACKDLGAKQKKVLDAIRLFPDVTNAELEKYTGWKINTITPRVGELRKAGLVLDAGIRKCKATGHSAHAWKAKHPVLPPAREEKPQINSPLFQ